MTRPDALAGLTPAQLDGNACVVCGRDLPAAPLFAGVQMSACEACGHGAGLRAVIAHFTRCLDAAYADAKRELAEATSSEAYEAAAARVRAHELGRAIVGLPIGDSEVTR